MSEVDAEIEIPVPLADLWDLYFDRERWPDWVDGFARTTTIDGYPGEGGKLAWESTPAGRGSVRERVLEHDPRRLHRIAYLDPESEGELETRFEIVPSGDSARMTRVSQRLSYRLVEAGPFAMITDLLFIRGQMRGSLQRSLIGLKSEAAVALADSD